MAGFPLNKIYWIAFWIVAHINETVCLVFIESHHCVSHGISRSFMIAECVVQTKQSQMMFEKHSQSLQVSTTFIHIHRRAVCVCEVLLCRKLQFYTAYCSLKPWKRNSANSLQFKYTYHSLSARLIFLHLFRFGIGVAGSVHIGAFLYIVFPFLFPLFLYLFRSARKQ